MDRKKTIDLAEAASSPWDVIVVGGALSGGATAMEILRRKPDTRVLIVESSEAFKRRVGESTVEVSAYFLGKVLGLSGELNRRHISKQGLRFWFSNANAHTLEDCSEIGPKHNVLFPGYQIDRAQIDQSVLDKASTRGAFVLRPAKAKSFERADGALQSVTVESGGEARTLQARWLVDATGVRAIVGRSQGWTTTNEEHPIATAWGRWTGVIDWEDEELACEFPEWSARAYGVRNNATNHLIGDGWWAWFIPLANGDVSIGVVYDQRLAELPSGERLPERLAEMLRSHPAGERLLRDAQPISGDVHFRRNISYRSERFATDGLALVGDAAGFIDPFYSPGLDWLCYSTMASAKLIADSLEAGRTCAKELARFNESFRQSYHRWFTSLYKDKYYYMGDYDLMKLAFRLDLGLYYLGVVSRPYRHGSESLVIPSLGQREAVVPAAIMSFYNRRLAAIARKRRANGSWGRHNNRRWYGFTSYRLHWSTLARVGGAFLCLAWLELGSLFSRRRQDQDDPGRAKISDKRAPAA